MASSINGVCNHVFTLNHVQISSPHNQSNGTTTITTIHDHKDKTETKTKTTPAIDYTQRAQWLRAAVLGANDGLVSVSSLMMGIGAVKTDIKAMLLAGFSGLVAGACSMAIGEFVSVYTQRDIEKSEIKRNKMVKTSNNITIISQDLKVEEEEEETEEDDDKETKLPNPAQAAAASALAFSIGAVVPLMAAAFVKDYRMRLGVVMVVASLALVGFGWIGARLGRVPVGKSCARVLVGGLMAMGISFGLTKLMGNTAGFEL